MTNKVITFQGKPIVDALVPLTIEVTEEDIACATQKSETDCAIAQSLKRRRTVVSARVGCAVVLIEHTNRWVRYYLSHDDQKRTELFDMVSMFIPGIYEIVPPPEAHKLGARKGTASGSNKREGKARSVYASPARRHVISG